MIDKLRSAGFYEVWPMDEAMQCFIADLVNRYRLGLPPVLQSSRGQPLLAEHLLNDDLDLGEFEHPAVLATIAVGDPFLPNGVAAASRFMPRLAVWRGGDGIATAIGRESRHDRVREGVTMAVRYGFSQNALQGLRWLAQRSVDDDRQAARRELVEYLESLVRGERNPDTLIDDLLAFEYRLSMSMDLFRRLLVNLVESQKIPVTARIRVVRELHRLPKPLRFDVLTRVSLLPPTTRANLAVRRALEDVVGRLSAKATSKLARLDSGGPFNHRGR